MCRMPFGRALFSAGRKSRCWLTAATPAILVEELESRVLLSTIPAMSGSGNFNDGTFTSVNLQQSTAATTIGIDNGRVPIYPNGYYNFNTSTVVLSMDSFMQAAYQNNISPLVQFAYKEGDTQPIGNQSQWYAIGQAWALRYGPGGTWDQQNVPNGGNSSFGVTVFEAFNEPDNTSPAIPHTIGGNATSNAYYYALEGLADGVHSVNSSLNVIPGGLNIAEFNDPTCLGYIPDIAPLLNNGTLNGLDLHTYYTSSNPISSYTSSASHQFQEVLGCSTNGITVPIKYYSTEFNDTNTKETAQQQAAGLLTGVWDQLGTVEADGLTAATQLACPFTLFVPPAGATDDGLEDQLDPWIGTVQGQTYQLVMQLTRGMSFTSLDPLHTGSYVLSGPNQEMWVWQDRSGWSNETGTSFNITGIPATANELDVYGWDGLRETITLSGQSSYDVTGLPGNETYMFLAKTPSSSVPASASDLTVEATASSQVVLTWRDNSENETGFKIERATNGTFTQNDILLTTTAANITQYIDMAVSAGTTYYYRVRATNANGDGANSNVADTTVWAVGDIYYDGLEDALNPITAVSLSTTQTVNNLYVTAAPSTPAGGTGASVLEWDETDSGNSTATQENQTVTVQAVDDPIPADATQLNFSCRIALGNTTLPDLSTGSNPRQNSTIQLKLTVLTASGSTTTFSSAVDNITDAVYQAGFLAIVGNATVPAGNYTALDGLTAVYNFRTTKTGSTLASQSQTLYLDDFRVSSNGIAATSVPSAPSNLTALALSATSVNLGWADNSFNETGFAIERATNSAFTLNDSIVATTAANIATYSDTSLTSGTGYYYRVFATNAVGASADSNVIVSHPTTTTTALTASNTSPSYDQPLTFTATVSPANGSGETGTVQFQIDGSIVGSPVILSGNTATYTTSTLTAGNHTVVAAYSGDGNFTASTSPTFTQTITAVWFIPSTAATWNASTLTLTMAGDTMIIADPNVFGVEPIIAANAGNLTVDTKILDGGDGDAVVHIGRISGNGTTTVNGTSLLVAGNFSQAALVNDGTVTLEGTSTIGQLTGPGNLTIGNGSSNNTVQLTAVAIPDSFTNTQQSLTIDTGSTLDITDNSLLLNYGNSSSPLAAVKAAVANGTISSSTANAGNLDQYTVGYADATEMASVPTGNVKLIYTLSGDAILGGTVNFNDYSVLQNNYNQSGRDWSQGDFNHDGAVNFNDYSLLQNNYNQSVKATPALSWPTPAAITYGTALSTAQLDATASVPGSFAYSPALGTVLAAGAQALSATFTPTDTTDYNSVTSSVNLTVNKAATILTTTSSSGKSIYAQAVTFTATIAPASGSGATGTVQFQIDGGNVGTPVTDSGDTASYTVATLALGNHSVAAIYSGDSNFLGSTAPTFIQNIGRATLTYTMSINDDGTGHYCAGHYAVYATDSLNNSGLASYDIHLGGAATITNYGPQGSYDDGEGCHTNDEVGFTFLRTASIASPVTASQDTVGYAGGGAVILVYGFGQTAGNLANDAAPGSTGAAGNVTQAAYGSAVDLIKGTFTGAAPTFTSQSIDTGNVLLTDSGYGTQAAVLAFSTVTVMSSNLNSPALLTTVAGAKPLSVTRVPQQNYQLPIRVVIGSIAAEPPNRLNIIILEEHNSWATDLNERNPDTLEFGWTEAGIIGYVI